MSMPISDDRAARIEAKVDELTTAVSRLILIDERQMRQGERLGAVEGRQSELEKSHIELQGTVNKWLWFFSGVSGVLTFFFTVGQALLYFLHK